MAKQVKSVRDLDRISSLPDSVLCHILSFLPIKVAVQTSVLSPRWKYVFNSMPTLEFRYCLSGISSGLVAESFKSFVDRLLSFPNHVTLECFRLYEIHRYNDYLRVYGWICAALWRGVTASSVLPNFLFTSQSLVTLKLEINHAMKVPSKVCLPNLKSLHPKRINFSDGGSIHRLISSCLALKDLVMYEPKLPQDDSVISIHSLSLKRMTSDFSYSARLTTCALDFNYTFMINTPNLVDFKYVGPMAIGKAYCLSTMNSLKTAYVNLEIGTAATVSILLQGISDAKSLHLTIKRPEMLIRVPPEPVLEFHKLVELKLEIHKEYRDWQGAWIIQFLRCAPNLERLQLDLPVLHREFKPLPLPVEVPPCLSFQLKEIKIRYFEGNEHMFEMISYFLKHASVLEALKIGIEKDGKLSIMKKLLELPRNSKKC